MFEEDCCLQCGKPSLEGRIYCSPACEDLDNVPSGSEPALSPSHSTASSAVSSPYLPPSLSALSLTQIPPLTLDYHHSTQRVKSPPAMWYDSDEDTSSVVTDDSGVRARRYPHHQYYQPQPPQQQQQQLIYARRPSATNNRSMIPMLRSSRRASSSTTTTTTSTSTTGTTPSKTTSTSDSLPSSPAESSSSPLSHVSYTPPGPSSLSHSRKRANRASLPAHFSLLASPTLRPTTSTGRPAALLIPALNAGGSGSGGTIVHRPSPSTPKLARPQLDAAHALAGSSPSSAPLASCIAYACRRPYTPAPTDDDDDGYGDEEDEADEDEYVAVDDGRRRGRRRLPAAVEERGRSRRRSRSRSRSARVGGDREEVVRGRRRPARADGWMGTTEHGFGYGRTGLMAREREMPVAR